MLRTGQVGGPCPTIKNSPLFARVVELVDTGDLKSPDSNIVPVQVRPRAPFWLSAPSDSIQLSIFLEADPDKSIMELSWLSYAKVI